ncbi:hypothetical protein SSP24_25930 [Streptomyces spinoverrucosus]|uniref:SMI1/KNR4 family protein n=1 Tax=Streptomyces spinoverrucosus TaxID=284043 RepID=A0A4Y3VFS9_9ACTN|nr:hypothetical protein SSP24_25930 [Streptomyces spinoverrucosus]GHB60814.1 hypothetical protein GCM10010397_33770 [Streptomyces spinoverrucosus]
MSSFESLLGGRQRLRPAAPQSWRAVEEWLGRDLPADYKEFVNGYGDALWRKLGTVAHSGIPQRIGSMP